MSTEERLAALEQRLRDLEDREAIAELIAAYGPFVDGGAADDVAAQWTEDGIYDVAEITMHGRDPLRAVVRSRNEQGWIKGGCAHFLEIGRAWGRERVCQNSEISGGRDPS